MKGFTNRTAKLKPNFHDVFKLLREEEVYTRYIDNFTINTVVNSPIGAIDKHASFSTFYSTKKQKILFKEHRYGYTGDCVDLVRYIFNYPTNERACMRILHDFGLDEGYEIDNDIEQLPAIGGGGKVVISVPKTERKIDIDVTIRNWEDYDLKYWKQFGITEKYLKYANIYPIKYYYINGFIRIPDRHSYVYVEKKDKIITYKIYQPFSKTRKWLNNNDHSVWELWHMLPKKGNILVVTKSRKDALSIMATMRIPSTSLQAEGTIPKPQVTAELRERFKHIFLLYDNDMGKDRNYGREYGKKIAKVHGFTQVEIPDKYKEKDYSDLVKRFGVKSAKEITMEVIKKELIKKQLIL